MRSRFIVVDGVVPAEGHVDNIRGSRIWEFALDQRVFGPRKLMVVLAEADGTFLGLMYTERPCPLEAGIIPCIKHLGRPAAAAVILNDERVTSGPPEPEIAARFHRAKSLCASLGVHLVDWICCDDDLFRSSKLSLAAVDEWWDVPGSPSDAAA